MLIISLATAGTVFTLNIYKRGDDEEPVPRLVQKIFFNIVAKMLFIRIKVNKELDSSIKEIFGYLKSYHISSSIEKFIHGGNSKLLKLNKNYSVANEKESFLVKTISSDLKENKRAKKTNIFEIKYNNQNYSDMERSQNADVFHTINCNSIKLSPSKLQKSNKILVRNNSALNIKSEKFFRPDNKNPNLIVASTSSNHLKPERIHRSTSDGLDYALKLTNNNNNVKAISSSSKKLEKSTDKLAISYYQQHFDSHNNLCCSELIAERKRLAKLLKVVNENLEKKDLKEIINICKQEIKAQWTQLAQVLDTLLAFSFTISTLFLFFYLINLSPNVKIF